MATIIKNRSGHGFKIGEIVTVVKRILCNDGYSYKCQSLSTNECNWLTENEVLVINQE